MRAMRLPMAVLLAAALAACGGARATDGEEEAPEPAAAVRLVVENKAFSDVGVFVVGDGGSRRRVGTVIANRTEDFTLNRAWFPSGRLRLLAEPVGGGRQGGSGQLAVRPGQTITFTVQPDFATSFATVN